MKYARLNEGNLHSLDYDGAVKIKAVAHAICMATNTPHSIAVCTLWREKRKPITVDADQRCKLRISTNDWMMLLYSSVIAIRMLDFKCGLMHFNAHCRLIQRNYFDGTEGGRNRE